MKTRTGSATGSKPVTSRMSSAPVTEPTNRAPSRPSSAIVTADSALPETDGLSGGRAYAGSRSRPFGVSFCSTNLRPTTPAATPTPTMPTKAATDLTGQRLRPIAAATSAVPSATGSATAAHVRPPTTIGKALRTFAGQGTKVGPREPAAITPPAPTPAAAPSAEGNI